MKKMNQVTIHIPATIANLVCGYDILGMAIHEPYDELTLTITGKHGISIQHHDAFELPADPKKNISGVALQAMLDALQDAPGIKLDITKHIKPGSGLGSSASAAAGPVVALNHLLGNPFSREQLVGFAMVGEAVASGVQHADNVAPCIYGGVTLIKSLSPLEIVPVSSPPLFISVLHPQVEVKTADARAMLPRKIFLKDAVYQWGNVAGLIAGMANKDYGLIGRSLEDIIIEPVRSILVPKFTELKAASLAAGALGGGISGAGPSIFMISQAQSVAEAVAQAMEKTYRGTGIAFNTYVSALNYEGIKMITS